MKCALLAPPARRCLYAAGSGSILPQDSWQGQQGAAGFTALVLRLLTDSWEP